MKYNVIRNEPLFIELYERIKNTEDISGGPAYHDISHVLRVVTTVDYLLTSLGFDSDYIDETKIAAYLHDLGCINGKKKHAYNSFNIVSDYIFKNGLILDYQDEVLDAIRYHSDSTESTNVMREVLKLADKLDITKYRLTENSRNLVGMDQIRYIEKIDTKIENNKLLINFITTNKFDLNKISKWYFMNKVVSSIVSFSKLMNLEYRILFNDSIYNVNYSER